MSAAPPRSGARFSPARRPLFHTTHPAPEEVLGIAGLGQMGKALSKLQEWNWNGTAGSASVCPRVDAALGAFHVLFPGEERARKGHHYFWSTRLLKPKTKAMQLR